MLFTQYTSDHYSLLFLLTPIWPTQIAVCLRFSIFHLKMNGHIFWRYIDLCITLPPTYSVPGSEPLPPPFPHSGRNCFNFQIFMTGHSSRTGTYISSWSSPINVCLYRAFDVFDIKHTCDWFSIVIVLLGSNNSYQQQYYELICDTGTSSVHVVILIKS